MKLGRVAGDDVPGEVDPVDQGPEGRHQRLPADRHAPAYTAAGVTGAPPIGARARSTLPVRPASYGAPKVVT